VDVVGEGVLKLLLSVSPEAVEEGDQITIKVTDSVEKKAVAGADVFFGGKKVDKQTGTDGTVSYWVTAPGTYTINATKAGYIEGETVIEVAEKMTKFTFSDLSVEPASVEAEKAVNISASVTNSGTTPGEAEVELLVNNESVDAQNVSLGSGESKLVSFSHTEEDAGTYNVTIGDLSGSYEVTKKAPFLNGTATLGILATAFVLLRRRRT
jgi:hypothetical protein